MQVELHIRQGREADASIVANFNVAMALETEQLDLELTVVEAGVKSALTDSSKARYFVAESGGQVVGQLMITYEWSDWRNGNIWWMQSVYVHPDFRRRGIFRALYEHACRESQRAGAVGIRLYVETHNVSAQATYQRLGMRDAGYRVLQEMFCRDGNSLSSRP